MSPLKNLRPNCDEILRNKKLWALDLQQLRKVAESQLNELKSSDKSFYSNFIQIKLINEPKNDRKKEKFFKWWK